MNRSESRYFATAARMDEAFLTLLAKKDFEYITVKEICEVAEVNRSADSALCPLRSGGCCCQEGE